MPPPAPVSLTHQDLQAALAQLLDAPLNATFDRLGIRARDKTRQSLLSNFAKTNIATLRDLLRYPTPPATAFELIMEAAKRSYSDQKSDIPRKVTEVLYFACASATLARTKLHDGLKMDVGGTLHRGLQKSMRLEWVDEGVQALLDDGVTFILNESHEPALGDVAPPPDEAITTAKVLEEIERAEANSDKPAPGRVHRLMQWASRPAVRIVASAIVIVLMAVPLCYQLLVPSNWGEPIYEGKHDAPEGTRIAGWAWDRAHPDAKVQVTIEDGVNDVVTVTADALRDDLIARGIGDGRHGFTYDVPANLKDGKRHMIWIRVAGTKRLLDDSPRSVMVQK